MRVYCFFKSLPQQILSTFCIGDVLEDCQYQVVADQAFRGREKPKIPHDDPPLVGRQSIGLPSLNVLVHGNFRWHPVIGATIVIMLPCPFIFQGHQLVNIDLMTVNQPLFTSVNTFRFSRNVIVTNICCHFATPCKLISTTQINRFLPPAATTRS